MTLSKEQIEHLFTFTQKKFVHWYDLQVELVDHLANKIEAEMATNKALSFERALGNVYASFGIFGFAKIVREKEEALRKANNKLLWQEIGNQFTWPNLIRSLAILGLIFTVVFQFSIPTLAIATIVLYCIDIAFNGRFNVIKINWNFLRKSKTKKTSTQKNLMMLQSLPAFSVSSIIYFQFMVMRYNEVLFTENDNLTTSFKISFSLLVFGGILLYSCAKRISLGIIFKAKQIYPEAFA